MEARQFLTQKRKRLLAGVLGHCERATWWTELTKGQQEAFRQKVLDEVNVYHDNVLDVIRAIDSEGISVNAKIFEMLDRIHNQVATEAS